MDQTNRSQRRGGGDQKRSAKGHRCIYAKPMDTDNSVVKPGWGTGGGRIKGEMGNLCKQCQHRKRKSKN